MTMKILRIVPALIVVLRSLHAIPFHNPGLIEIGDIFYGHGIARY
jgi:hypothetical protein